jgi:hypothetical protein
MAEQRLAAALCWFDEPEEFLTRLVRSLAPVCDALVAFDGRWDLMPGDGDVSPDGQLETLERVAAAVQLPAHVVSEGPWGSQVEKRDALMAAAAEQGDWVLVIDGDEYLDAAHISRLRAALAKTTAAVAQVSLRILNRQWPYSELGPMLVTQRRLFRAGARVDGPAHNCYRRDDVWLAGDPAVLELAPALDVTGMLTIEHENQARPAHRREAAGRYRRARRGAQLEAYA